MGKINNISSVRSAARLACYQQHVSIKQANVSVVFHGFRGLVNDTAYEGRLGNQGTRWFTLPEFEQIDHISGSYECIEVIQY